MRKLSRRAIEALALTWRAGRLLAFVGFTVTICQGLLPVSIAWLTKVLLDAIQAGPGDPSEVLPTALGLGICGICVASLPHAVNYIRSRQRRRISLLVDENLFTAVNRMAGLSHFDEPRLYDRLRLAQQAASSTPSQVTMAIFGVVQGVAGLAGYVGVLLIISPPLTLVTLAAAIPSLFLQLTISRRVAATMWQLSPRERRRTFYRLLMIDPTAIKEIRLFTLGKYLIERMRQEATHINTVDDRLDRKVMYAQGPLAAAGGVIAAGGLLWIVSKAASGGLSVGDVTAFIAAVAGVQGTFSVIVASIAAGYRELLNFGHYVDILEVSSDLPVPAVPSKVPRLSSGIVLHDIWFRYSQDGPWILRGVDLTIPHGQSLALVGRNGAGKSTLVKLMCRLYDPIRGRITWDDVDLRDMGIDELRDRISAVFQDFVIYDLSVSDNIGVGDVGTLHEKSRITEAGRRAGADQFIADLSHGYDTMLSRMFAQSDDAEQTDSGVMLSGGQRQRLALARALMRKDRDLLILDEPSSGLDAIAEQEVHDALRLYQRGTTSILISHRLGAVRHADTIAVLKSGRIVEKGNHDQLMAANGEYAGLFQIQAANYSMEIPA